MQKALGLEEKTAGVEKKNAGLEKKAALNQKPPGLERKTPLEQTAAEIMAQCTLVPVVAKEAVI